jgi:4-amino-4-deoxy-L-arabinose transferase-like glycosyltransferase
LGLVIIGGLIGWFLLLPLNDILDFPDRISVLPNLQTDAAAYDAFARDFARTWQTASLPSKHPPGWMVVLAAVYATVGHSYVAGKLVSWVALAMTVALAAWIAHRVYGVTAGVVAALLCASSPGFRAYIGTLQYEVLTAALFTLFLALCIRSADAVTARAALGRAVFAGLAGAALVLTRETFVLVVPIAAVWLWRRLFARQNPRAHVVALALVAVAAAPAVVWSAWQTFHYQRLILISEKGPKEFELGNNPLANGAYNESLVGMGEPAGFQYIRQFPLEALRLAGRKVLYSFGVLRDGWSVPQPAAVWIWRATAGAMPFSVILPIVAGGWLLLLVIASLVMGGRTRWREWWILPLTAASILAVHVITLASYRFTVPVLPALYIIASSPIAWLIDRILPTLRHRYAAIAAVVVMMTIVIAQYQTWPLRAAFAAADLEGIAAANRVDDLSHSVVRLADAGRGERPVALLPDIYLPRGSLRVTTTMRMVDAPEAADSAVVRLWLGQVNGRLACTTNVSSSQLSSERFSEIDMRCELDRDGPATFALFSLGVADVAIESVRFEWDVDSRTSLLGAAAPPRRARPLGPPRTRSFGRFKGSTSSCGERLPVSRRQRRRLPVQTSAEGANPSSEGVRESSSERPQKCEQRGLHLRRQPVECAPRAFRFVPVPGDGFLDGRGAAVVQEGPSQA